MAAEPITLAVRSLMRDTAGMERRYPSRPRTGMIVGAAIFGALGAAVLLGSALVGHPDGHIGPFVVSPNTDRVLSLVCGSIAAVVVVLAGVILVVYRNATPAPELVLDEVGVTTPGPIWKLDAKRSVRYADVTAIRVQAIGRQQTVMLAAPTGKVWFASGHLPPGAFDEALAFVKQRLSTRVL